MISVRNTPFFTEYSINMLDDELMELLPDNKLISSEPNQLKFMNIRNEEQSPLMESIIHAVSNHLQASII